MKTNQIELVFSMFKKLKTTKNKTIVNLTASVIFLCNSKSDHDIPLRRCIVQPVVPYRRTGIGLR